MQNSTRTPSAAQGRGDHRPSVPLVHVSSLPKQHKLCKVVGRNRCFLFMALYPVTCVGAVKCSLLVSFHQITFFFFFSKPQSTEVQGLLRDQTFCPRWEHVQPACLLLHISLIPSYTDHENPPSVSGRGLFIYRKRLKPSAWKGLQLMAHLSVGFSLLSLLASCIDQLGI